MTDEATTDPRMFRALALLEKKCPPLLYGREPYWRAPIAVPVEQVFIPSWNWSAGHHDLPEGEEPITVDYNGAFLAAAGSVDIAWSQLRHYPDELDAWSMNPRRVLPGYYLIDNVNWAFGATIVSPLGNAVQLAPDRRIWVAAPTLVLLLELLAEGAIGDLIISDAWCTEQRTTFRDWIARLKVARNGLLDQRAKADTVEEIAAAKARYDAFKQGYGSAFSMMLTGKDCKTRRPDWAHTVYAQHAATSWRKAWRFSAIGPLLAMGNTDTVTVLRTDLERAVRHDKPPIRLDPSGRQLGHAKEVTDEPAPAGGEPAPDLLMSDTFEDVL